MKKLELALLAALVCITGLMPVSIIADTADDHAKACIQLPDEDIASTALACATALQALTLSEKTIPDAVQKRIVDIKKNGELHSILRSDILEIMKLNRRAFQSEKVLNRYGDERKLLADQMPIFEQCGLPRDSQLNPLPQYPHSFSHSDHGIKADYNESKGVLGCLKTKSGLAGVRAEPLAQHYYCTFPGNSPEIRSCFTFQIRVSSNTRSNSHRNVLVEDKSSDDLKVLERVRKEWLFAGTQQEYQHAKDTKIIPQNIINKVANYCSVDGRAARAEDLTLSPPKSYWHTSFLENYLKEVEKHNDPANTNESLINDYLEARAQAENAGSDLADIDQIDPLRNNESQVKPPLCWINETQRSVFQLMLSPALGLYFDSKEQLSIIREYYQCDDETIKNEYKASKVKQENYCPDNFDNWNG